MSLPLGLLPWLLLASSCGGTPDAPLRLRKVVLYQNGIGYFEHSGQAERDRLQISVRRSELDDALKTLTIVSEKDDDVSPRHGTVHTMTGDDAAATQKANPHRTVPMVVQVPEARGEDLRVSYSVPTPIWKATYRVVLDPKKGRDVLLQGWAAIQNTSGHDWNNVALSLATGAPLSFGVNLTRPTYSARPDVSNQLHAGGALGAVIATNTRPSDRDNDGILDVDDLCPLAEEDLDNFEDSDGCPDLDNDHDRILDVDDECPEDGETYNGVSDGDGCPDRGSIIVSDSKLEILNRVYFTANSTELLAKSKPILNAIAATLQGNPDILEIEIQGHAAANESDGWTLGEGRAVVVASYLVKAGIQSSRLRVQSYGDSLPLDTKSNPSAHAKNRRIDFLILERDEEYYGRQSRAESKKRPVRTAKKTPAPKKVSTVPSTTSSGGMVHYRLPRAVSIPNGESTLVPLVNAKVEGEEIYLFRPDANLPGSNSHPSRAVRVVNTGDLALVPGPIAVFAREAFAGEGLLSALSPGESAFIPFSLDRSAEVLVKESLSTRPKAIISITEGDMVVVDDEAISTEYTLVAGLTPPKRVYVQHQTRDGYELSAPRGSEHSGTKVLAPVSLSRGVRTTLRLREKTEALQTLSLEHDSVAEIRSYLDVALLPDAEGKELARILELRSAIELGHKELEARRSQRFDDRIRAYEIRTNLKALAQDQGSLRKRLKRELSESEKRGQGLASELAVASERLTKDRIELQKLLLALKYKAVK